MATLRRTSFAGAPGTVGNELELKFGRDRRDEVEAFAERLKMRAASQGIVAVMERLRQLRVS